MSSRSYLSIGDVLTLLRQEFPDVTISKIRFLESQGLVNPERTPSGYRKFYEHDVERLRWVLRQQREHFLPLKVIKDRLDEDGTSTPPAASTGPAAPVAAVTTASADGASPAADLATAPVRVGAGSTSSDSGGTTEPAHGLPGIETGVRHRVPPRAPVGVTAPGAAIGTAATGATATAATAGPVERAHRASMATQSAPSSARAAGTTADPPTANGSTVATGSHGAGTHHPDAHDGPAEPATPPVPKPARGTSRRSAAASTAARSGAAAPVATTPPPGGGGVDTATLAVAGASGASLSLEDLCAASGLSADDISELQEFGLLSATVAAGEQFFDEDAMVVAILAAKFAVFGIEARHLRLYKNAAEREAGFIEQIVIPMVRQRNPEARARASQTAEELAQLGQQMKASLLRTVLRDIL